jgi:biotin carboxylase
VAGEEGTLTGVRGVAEATRLPGVVEVGITAQAGQQVVLRHSFRDRLGYVIASAAGNAEAARTADAALALLASCVTQVTAGCAAAS